MEKKQTRAIMPYCAIPHETRWLDWWWGGGVWTAEGLGDIVSRDPGRQERGGGGGEDGEEGGVQEACE